jgi:hypothetical protein
MKASVVSFDMPTERPAGFWRHSPFEFWAVLIGWNQNIGLRIFTFGKRRLVMWEKAHAPRPKRHGFRSGDCLFSGLLQLGRGRA